MLSGDDVHAAVRVDLEAGDAAERGDVLVLLADRPLEQVDLDVARLLGEVAGGHVFALVGVQRAQEADRERPGGAEPVPAGMSATLTISTPGRSGAAGAPRA